MHFNAQINTNYDMERPRHIVTRTTVYAIHLRRSDEDVSLIRIPKGTQGTAIHQFVNENGLDITVVDFGEAYAYLGWTTWDAVD